MADQFLYNILMLRKDEIIEQQLGVALATAGFGGLVYMVATPEEFWEGVPQLLAVWAVVAFIACFKKM